MPRIESYDSVAKPWGHFRWVATDDHGDEPDEAGPLSEVGFACGTSPGHVESGEGRFPIERDRSDDGVTGDVSDCGP